jgi:hypothetical protein
VYLRKLIQKLRKLIQGVDIIMNYQTVLDKVENNELTPELAYKELYPEPKNKKIGKRAFFIKLKIRVPEEGRGVNTFLRILFALPIPMIFARMGLRIAERYTDLDGDIDLKEISRLMKYSKHTRINVDTDDAKVDIKIM